MVHQLPSMRWTQPVMRPVVRGRGFGSSVVVAVAVGAGVRVIVGVRVAVWGGVRDGCGVGGSSGSS